MEDFITQFLAENCGKWSILIVPFVAGWLTKSPQAIAKMLKRGK